MKNSPIQRFFNRLKSVRHRTAGSSPEELIQAAQQHFANDFPNPRRVECPHSATFSEQVRSRQFPDHELRRHVLACSECFRSYQGALEGQRRTLRIVAPPRPERLASIFSSPKLLAIACAGLLIVISTIAVVFWLQARWNGSGIYQAQTTNPVSQPVESRDNTASLAPPKPSIGSTTEKRRAEQLQSSANAKKSPERVAATKVEIDLQKSGSRGTSQDGLRHTVLVASHNELAIRLSSGSQPGAYKIMLTDPFGSPMRVALARTKDGLVLHANLKLTLVKPGRYLICITRAAEVPDCVPAVVISP